MRLIDLFTRALITGGGIGTIVAVLTVCVFLVVVAVPLFDPATTTPRPPLVAPPAMAPSGSAPILGFDEYRTQGFVLDSMGVITVFRADTGAQVSRLTPLGAQVPVCRSYDPRSGTVVFALDDGAIRFGRIRWELAYFEPASLPPHLAALAGDAFALHAWDARPGSDGAPKSRLEGIVQRTPAGQLRGIALAVDLEPPKKLAPGRVALLDHALSADGNPTIAFWLTGAPPGHGLHVVAGKLKVSLTTGSRTLSYGKVIAIDAPRLDAAPPCLLTLSHLGVHLLLAWPDGRALRVRCEPAAGRARLAETIDLVPAAHATLTAAAFAIGRETLVVGDSTGAVAAHFAVPAVVSGYETVRVRDTTWVFYEGSPEAERFRIDGTLPESATLELPERRLKLCAPSAEVANAYVEALTLDGVRFARARELAPARGHAVTSIAASQRSRTIAAGYADGAITLLQATSGKRLAEIHSAGGPVRALSITPKEDGFAALGSALAQWDLEVGHPEATLGALFTPVWYEGYKTTEHMWQSTAGEDASEPKLGLVPLVFGTIKATLYSMMFGAPLALLAALYASQFLHPKRKAVVKPVIELMASLPSVVLGFLAGLVFAPFVEHNLASLVGAAFTLPVFVLGGAYLWQLLPFDRAQKLAPYRLAFVALAMAVGVGLGLGYTGPWIEACLFEGDLIRYLDGKHVVPRFGSPTSGWFLFLLPACALASALVSGAVSQAWLGGRARNWTHRQTAVRDLAKFATGVAFSVAVAYALASVLTLVVDPRGPSSPIDTYIQRNALIVGFVMGFAVIPIIFTIADDALSSVPDHLRFASLGAGATPWQTAVRIVVPTAMSGLFSAVMIGLGRAVGETMIVLMAAGNTPIMQVNVFNGFRTLSANIATEMPEAVQGSTHYRTLFLAALLLFAMTFVLNTVAEVVRLRFRKRAGEL